MAEIRRYLRCSQAKAAQLRRTVLATLDPMAADADAPTIALRSMSARPRLVHLTPAIRVA
ncbi:hypothetical protein DIE19_33690 [Burkholderia sp. Bp9126]|nr:hypothetical protein DIE19_33690 [Burkholderia sp. Bp9126]